MLRILRGLLLVSFICFGNQQVQVPPTDLSKGNDKPGTLAHTTYLVNAQPDQKYPNAHAIPPTTDFNVNVHNPFENELASLPPELVDLSQVKVYTNYLVLEGGRYTLRFWAASR